MAQPPFEDVKARVLASKLPLHVIARAADISPQTLYAWLSGRIKAPRISSLERVAYVLRRSIVVGHLHEPEPERRSPALSRHQIRMALIRLH